MIKHTIAALMLTTTIASAQQLRVNAVNSFDITSEGVISNVARHTGMGSFTNTDNLDLATQAELDNLLTTQSVVTQAGRGSVSQQFESIHRELTQLRSRQGARGEAGMTGATGAQGEQGERGERGIRGADGNHGINGQAGINGVDGLNGQDGQNGQDGRDGRDGKDADMSVIGAYIAGNTALSFTAKADDGISFGLGGNEYGNAFAIGLNKSYGNHKVSAGLTSEGQYGGSYTFKW